MNQQEEPRFRFGVFDDGGDVADLIIKLFSPEQTLVYSDLPGIPHALHHVKPTELNSEDPATIKALKRHLFESCEVIVINLNAPTMNTLSYFTSSIIAILRDEVRLLFLASQTSLEPLLGMGVSEERERIRDLYAIGRLIVVPSITREILERYL